MEIISRARWGARHEDGFGPAPLPAREVWLHHSVAMMPDLEWIDADRDGVQDDEERAMRDLEDIGEARFGRGISYTWVVMPSGRIYAGHSVNRQGSHTAYRNDIARAVCLAGNYDLHRPRGAQVRSVAWLLQEGKRRGWIATARLNGGHRDLKATACPGQHAYAQIGNINKLAAGPAIGTEDEDMKANETFYASTYAGKQGLYGSYLYDQAARSMETLALVKGIALAVAPLTDDQAALTALIQQTEERIQKNIDEISNLTPEEQARLILDGLDGAVLSAMLQLLAERKQVD